MEEGYTTVTRVFLEEDNHINIKLIESTDLR
jgi:hypothetical protein